MIYAGIDVNIITHEKALEAGVEAFGLWAWGMCYAQIHETDGRLPRVAVLTALGGRRNVMHAKRLVSARLWAESEDGSWQIHNYGKKNQTAEEIQAKKAAAADRVRRWRERKTAPGNADGNADVTRDVRVTGNAEQRVRTDPSPTPSPPPDNTTRKQEGESAPARNGGSALRALRPDEPLTDQRRKDFETETFNLPARDIEPEWRMFVDDRIAKTILFASATAVDADWRKWVRRQNVIEAKARISAQNDHGGGGKRGERQPLGDRNAAWLKTGSDL